MATSSESGKPDQEVIDEVISALALVPHGNPKRTQLAKALGTNTARLSMKAITDGRIRITPEALSAIRTIVDGLRNKTDEILRPDRIVPNRLYQYPNKTGKKVRVTKVEHGQVSYVLDGTDISFQTSAVDFASRYVLA